MNVDVASSVRGSDTTRKSERRDEPTEAALIDKATGDASLAAQHTWGDLKRSLKDVVDVRLWTQTHPWVAMGVASAVGFTAAIETIPALTASRSQPANDADHQNGAARQEPVKTEKPAAAPPDHPWLNGIFDLAKVALSTGIAAAMQAHAAAAQAQAAHAEFSRREEPVREEVGA